MATQRPLRIRRGSSVRSRIKMQNNGEPVDLTGATWEVLENKLGVGNNALITFEITEPLNGISYMVIDKDVTRDLRVGTRIVRFRVVLANGTGIALAPQRITIL